MSYDPDTLTDEEKGILTKFALAGTTLGEQTSPYLFKCEDCGLWGEFPQCTSHRHLAWWVESYKWIRWHNGTSRKQP